MNSFLIFKEKLQSALLKTQRDPQSLRFLISSKYFSIEDILTFYHQGVRDFGENKVQEALVKIDALPKDIRWHFLGHLQSNKISKIKNRFDLIHSIDSYALAQKLSKLLQEPQKVLIQIKTSKEPTKTGFLIHEFKESLPKLLQLPYLKVKGLMTIAPKGATEEETRASFQMLGQLKKESGQNQWELSMGMSADYPIAIEEGATILRIGRALLNTL